MHHLHQTRWYYKNDDGTVGTFVVTRVVDGMCYITPRYKLFDCLSDSFIEGHIMAGVFWDINTKI